MNSKSNEFASIATVPTKKLEKK